MKVYHIENQYGQNFDLYDWEFYENSDPVFCEDKDYLEELIGRIHKVRNNFEGINFHIVTTIVEDTKGLNLF